MKGFIKGTVLAGGLSGLVSLTGCTTTYSDLVDPCYPQRYEAMAREEAYSSSVPQVQNGHVLDQTMWNFYFEPGTDKLTQGGLSQLAYLARRRPQPDTMIYLQAAQDLSYDPAAPDRFAASRYDLDTKRIQAVQKFLNAQTAGRRQDFQVVVHDPAEVGASAAYANVAVGKMVGGATGVLSSSTGGGGGNTTGGAGASGGGSGGSGGGGSGGR